MSNGLYATTKIESCKKRNKSRDPLDRMIKGCVSEYGERAQRSAHLPSSVLEGRASIFKCQYWHSTMVDDQLPEVPYISRAARDILVVRACASTLLSSQPSLLEVE